MPLIQWVNKRWYCLLTCRLERSDSGERKTFLIRYHKNSEEYTYLATVGKTSLNIPGIATSDGKVRFSSVQRGISLNLELNSRFGLGHFAEPRTGPTVQVRFWFEPVRTFGAWEKYFWPLFPSKSLENVNIYLIYLILDRGRLRCYDFYLINGCSTLRNWFWARLTAPLGITWRQFWFMVTMMSSQWVDSPTSLITSGKASLCDYH